MTDDARDPATYADDQIDPQPEPVEDDGADDDSED